MRMFPFFVHAKQNEFLQRNRIKVGLERYVENFRERGSGVAAKLAVQSKYILTASPATEADNRFKNICQNQCLFVCGQ